MVCAQLERVIEEGLELDLGVAQYVRIRRATGGILAQEFREHAVLVFGREIDGLERNPNDVRRGGRIDQILPGRAVLVVIVVFPVLHEEADDLVALLFQQPGCNRRIDAARKSQNHSTFAHDRSADGCVCSSVKG
jgi:hypothetical protein